ncbi:MAG: GFA family protein [Rhizobiales bacterium]|nr:GFA family protein [Hyphomicrobiales bacterium]MBI3672051.1 GFA family protein [Hyphomicrobiales bacterium]
MKTGSCLCGAVKYEVHGPLRPVIACHCSQCRKQTGTYMSATAAEDGDFRLTEARGLRWYRSSPSAKRGFCGECGSVLFWKGDGLDNTSITAGSLDGRTGLALEGHIYCADAGDYYEIAGGSYRKSQWED